MATSILFLILLAALQVHASDLDHAFQDFLASSSTARSYKDNSNTVKNLYKLYRNEFNRLPATSDEENNRYAAFNDTVYTLLKHYQQGDKTYSVGLNKFADWTAEELNSLRGLKRPEGEIPVTNAKPNQRFLSLDGKEVQTKSISIPTSYDLTQRVVAGTNTPVLRPVKNQGTCGACYAFAFVVLLEAQYAFQLKTGTDLSEQQMVDCSTLDHGCNGGYFTNTFKYISNNNWQVNGLTSYPYLQKASRCAFKSVGGGGVKFGSLLYRMLPTNDVYSMQQALITYGPLYTSFFAGDSTTHTYRSIQKTFSSYNGGIFQPAGCPASVKTSNHAVVIIGYGIDSSTNVPYWKVRNSWDTTWGEQGYFRIRRGVNMCGIESEAFFIAKPA